MQQESLRRFVVLHPLDVSLRWSELRRLLLPSIEFANGEFEVDDLLEMVRDKQAFVMAILDQIGEIQIAAVCQTVTMPRKRTLHVLAMGGTGFAGFIGEFWDRVADAARLIDCQSVRAAVRPSMLRLCRRVNSGASPIYTIMERPV